MSKPISSTRPKTTHLISHCRRSILAGLAISPFGKLTPTTRGPDDDLIALGVQFDEAVRVFDKAKFGTGEFEPALDRLEFLITSILNANATTSGGLYAKAKVVCWEELGDLDPGDGYTTVEKFALSIVLDLIRSHAPERERPGAITRLLDEFD